MAAIIERDGRFLLVEEHTSEGLKLNNPAGHLDEGESPEQGAVREVLEETTRVFAPDHLVGVYLSRFQRHPPSPPTPRPRGEGSDSRATGAEPMLDVTFLRFAFAGSVGDADPTRTLDTGIVRTLWMTIDELRACPERHRSPLLLTCVEDFLAGQRYPLSLIHADPSLYTPEVRPWP